MSKNWLLFVEVFLFIANSAPLPTSSNVVERQWKASRPVVKSSGQGGKGGESFDDLRVLNKSIVGIHSINISYGEQINAIQVTYLLSNRSIMVGPMHGKISKPPITITLGPDEYVTRITGRTNGDLIDQLTIETLGPPEYERKVYGPFGGSGKKIFVFEGYILGFHGRSGDLLDNIGVYSIDIAKKSPEFGTHTDDQYIGRPFDDIINLGVPPIVGISKLNVWHNSLVPSVQFEYLLLGGGTKLGERHGTEFAAGNLTTITFDEGEQLIELRGKTGEMYYDYIDQLSFTTLKKGGVYARYGPFGKLGRTDFLFKGNICGFFGSSGSYVFGLGAYFV